MNAELKKNIKLSISTLTAMMILVLASCNNPVNTGLIEDLMAGIITDTSEKLVAGIPLNGDIILKHSGVSVSENTEGNASIDWVEGLSGSALKTDEDGDFIRIADGTLPELTVTGSVEVWVKPEADTVNYYTGVVHKGDNPELNKDIWAYVDEAWSLQFNDDCKAAISIICETEDEDGNQILTTVGLMADTAIEKGKWSHLAATWFYDETTGETTVKLYVNGVEAVSRTEKGVGPVRDTDGDLIIGSQLPEQYNEKYGHFTFKGLIDEVGLYNRVRTAAEIRADYNNFASEL